MSKKKKQKKNKTFARVATLIMGVGFAGSTLAIALSSVFSQNNYSSSNSTTGGDTPSIEEQIQMQVSGYEKVLEREPSNITALEGLAQLYLQTRNTNKAIPILEKLVKFYPERQEYSGVLQILKQQQASENTEKSPEENNNQSPQGGSR